MSRLNKLFPIFAALAVLCLAPATSKADSSQCDAAPGNLVVNCGFETGTASGYSASNVDVYGNIGLQHSGTYGAYFSGSGATLSQNLATVPGSAYTLSFYLASFGAGTNVQVTFGGGTPVLNIVNSGAFSYTLFTFTGLTASSTSTQLLFSVNTSSAVLLDDIVVTTDVPATATPEPATMLLLGTGLAGVAAKVRKRRRAAKSKAWS